MGSYSQQQLAVILVKSCLLFVVWVQIRQDSNSCTMSYIIVEHYISFTYLNISLFSVCVSHSVPSQMSTGPTSTPSTWLSSTWAETTTTTSWPALRRTWWGWPTPPSRSTFSVSWISPMVKYSDSPSITCGQLCGEGYIQAVMDAVTLNILKSYCRFFLAEKLLLLCVYHCLDLHFNN